MIGSIIFNYSIGLLIGNTSYSQNKRKFFLTFSIIANLCILYIFKYFNFSLSSINLILNLIDIDQINSNNLIMPIGISFYTFQAISYTIDVYRTPEIVQKNILKLGLYITFFPQLIAGPIIRYHDINNQLSKRSHNCHIFEEGIERFIYGLGKKVLLANIFGEVADKIYALPFESYGTYYCWIAIISYSLQIYYDFSGYSDMAIGLGKMFGFRFMENFNYPYNAKSITDFWRRWHISLSTWFKDYVYIPLGGNRKGRRRTSLNLYIVFFITGLWHGASYNFILWGLGHGTLLFIEKHWLFKYLKRDTTLTNLFSRLYTLTSVVILWTLFRNGTKQSLKLLMKMFGINYTIFTNHFIEIDNSPNLFLIVDSRYYLLLVIGILFSVPWWKKINFKYNTGRKLFYLNLKNIYLLTIFILSYASLANNAYNPFIYFRF